MISRPSGSANHWSFPPTRSDTIWSKDPMKSWGISLFGAIAVISLVLAVSTIWLFLTDPVTVATAVNDGEITPLVRNLAQVLFDALRGLLKYL
jgi:hypothetical protein